MRALPVCNLPRSRRPDPAELRGYFDKLQLKPINGSTHAPKQAKQAKQAAILKFLRKMRGTETESF